MKLHNFTSAMRIDELDQEDADIDWFAVDSQGHVLHVASGGGILPESVAASQEVLLELHQYFLTLPDTTAAEAAAVEDGAEQAGGYQSFARYARRGLFSFEKTRLHERADTRYHLVARPVVPLLVSQLPKPLAQLLSRTQLPEAVVGFRQLDVTRIL
ncbi:hypothetical protein [Hymenobacter cellulosilyticus]|uniref:Uncharacterized protein n=1 Tax=Hymenobacter cellulosilyticus TaxID=2932248 RepID=A0A8T9Q4W4_9BACT|nr:hypothetical protein [Hymenobacter cellulosilyticus]UOQ72115.1 hypothetical protein MUN79_26705 [Hymenobacter cellulosilyticus]